MGQKRWMLFVDGENFTMRGQTVAAAASQELTVGRYHVPDVFLWPPGVPARRSLVTPVRWAIGHELDATAVRAYYYTSAVGDSDRIDELRGIVKRVGFDPRIFKRTRNRRSKAVDITLAVDLLSHAHDDHFDVAVILAGDGDYVPLVEAVKRMGKLVWVGFFDNDVHREMQLVPDFYTSMESWLLDPWKAADPKALS